MQIRARQLLGKYRIERKLGSGGCASVFQAKDTVQGHRVAVKVLHPVTGGMTSFDEQTQEVRLLSRLEHPNILRLLNAEVIDDRFVMVFPLGAQSLADRMKSRRSVSVALGFAGQMLEALAYAHDRRVLHCDIKPENFILFPGGVVMLSDFGISKFAPRTVSASGSGTIGYVAPEQAMGKPAFHSDVFSLGLLLYELLTTHLPEWPFEWPPAGYDRLRKSVHPDIVAVIRRAVEPDARKRFRDGGEMLAAFKLAQKRMNSRPTEKAGARPGQKRPRITRWRRTRHREYEREFGGDLHIDGQCRKCGGPVSELMEFCPWCSAERAANSVETRFPQYCPRCRRGMKLDWSYCAWCHGPGFEPGSTREYSDKKYSGRCSNPKCSRKVLMPFMRYCPWCRKKVEKKWPLGKSRARCASCGWGIAKDYWSCCAWCGSAVSSG